tara:strand:- start:367 stop:786 length:420 start_codon:yes stop_codon:yes gene_type:complete
MNDSVKKIRKGGMVKLNASCVTELENQFMFEPAGTEHLTGRSKPTQVDADQWAKARKEAVAECIANGEDAWHITMNDAGESRLPPTSVNVKIYPNRAYQVLRARCASSFNYHRQSGQCLILDLETGREVYVDRHNVEAV